jgi:hypothetical protein
MTTLTSVNSVFALSIAGLYPVAQILQGYAADDAFMADDVDPVETLMGVDGLLSGGYTPYPTKIHVTLQANSASMVIFDNWLAAQKAAREIYIGNGNIAIPALGQAWSLGTIFLTGANPIPGVKKILTVQDCNPSPQVVI